MTDELKERILHELKEHPGWWQVERLAYWLDAPINQVKEIWNELEKEGLLERKRR